MITRLRAKMATNENSESQEFDTNNQLGDEGLEDSTVDSNESNNTVAGHSQNRARGPSNCSEMNIAMLMEFINERMKKQAEIMGRLSEESKNQNEETRRQNEQQKEEIIRKNEEQIGNLKEEVK